MRISDWSSDVCSSDLDLEQRQMLRLGSFGGNAEFAATQLRIPFLAQLLDVEDLDAERTALGKRSEEHTSELQSLMRISYAVFCLKKKIRTTECITPSHNLH